MTSTMTERARARGVAGLVAAALLVWAGPVSAVGPPPGDGAAPAAVAADDPRAQVQAALEAGDLTRARDLAVRAREQDPENPELWALEARVHERRGDLAAAKAARRHQLELLPPAPDEARARAEASLARLEAASRGTRPDEPPSSHREAFDARRAPPPPKAKPQRKAPEPPPPARERLVKKWYFWVTLGAIVASAAAITGIAIKAAVSKREDALDAQASTPSPDARAGALLRF